MYTCTVCAYTLRVSNVIMYDYNFEALCLMMCLVRSVIAFESKCSILDEKYYYNFGDFPEIGSPVLIANLYK